MTGLKPADPFPPVAFSMMSGETMQLSDSLGQWIAKLASIGAKATNQADRAS